MGGLAQAHEMTSLVVFLARQESAFVTGQAYRIDDDGLTPLTQDELICPRKQKTETS